MSVPRPARPVAEEWLALENVRGDGTEFDPELAGPLPSTAQRWIRHAIAPGTPLARGVRLTMEGSIKLGSWRTFRAIELIAPEVGFIWAASTRVAGLPVSGFDRYTGGTGKMRWRIAGLIPVLSAEGPDVTTSALGRLVGESVLVPTVFASAQWTDLSADTTRMTRTLGDQSESVQLEIAVDGSLRGVRMQRWGDPDGSGFSRRLFTVTLSEEKTFSGVTIPIVMQAAWEGDEFFRARIGQVDYA